MDRKTRDRMVSSSRSDYGTPQWLFDQLDREFHFSLDVCANEKNHKCSAYYTEKMDGLEQSWPLSGNCWMNPPYGRVIPQWMEKAAQEYLMGVKTVALIPARVDTLWWLKFCLLASEVRFIVGRLKFVGAVDPALFPSAIVVYGEKKVVTDLPHFSWWKKVRLTNNETLDKENRYELRKVSPQPGEGSSLRSK